MTATGAHTEIGPDSRLVDTIVGESCVVEKTVGRDAVIGDDCHVGPFAVLEPGSEVAAGTRTGAFYTAAVEPDE